ncbi:MAG: RNA polymerase sigma factor [Prevotella histicola]|nr:RNA polymerase sigma factor [Prevotella histicola]
MKKVSFRNDVLPLKNELFRLALRITLNRVEAEDIVQDTLIKVWDRRFEWESIDSIEAFSLTVCRNLSLDRLRKKENNNDSLEDVNIAEPVASSNPQDQMIQEDRVSLVRQIIDSLPEKQRSCMQLRDFEGKSYKEIAQVLDITEEQVKVNIFRARQMVKQKYLKLDNYGL